MSVLVGTVLNLGFPGGSLEFLEVAAVHALADVLAGGGVDAEADAFLEQAVLASANGAVTVCAAMLLVVAHGWSGRLRAARYRPRHL